MVVACLAWGCLLVAMDVVIFLCFYMLPGVALWLVDVMHVWINVARLSLVVAS